MSCDRTGVLNLPRLARSAAKAFLPLLVLALSTPPAHARQTDRSSGRITITGQVLDAATRQPVNGALVELAGTRRHSFTDKQGRFVLKGIPAGRYEITAEQLGYATGRMTQSFDEATSSVEILMTPDPVVLEGIQVTNDRLLDRRRAVATSVFAYDAEDLRRSGAWDAHNFVRQRVFARSCPDPFSSLCILRRGRVISPNVYIDESRMVAGAEFLTGLPLDDVYL
ncbi:MAG: carboxypeptidase-like regulatory domain-containing protein, partial [Longimicrobiales bacterium]